jgi:hypothetical protein
VKDSTKRILAVICLIMLVTSVFTSCKGKDDGQMTLSTEDPFAATEFEPVTTANDITTDYFSDFATTTVPATTAPGTTRRSGSTPSYTYPGTTSVAPTLPPNVDPDILSTTNPTSKVDLKKLLTAFGYVYDPDEDCFYSDLDVWQRKGGFAPHYDLGAFLLTMHYLTFTVDFDWGGESWRMQFWKGNYGPLLDGAEIGVYTKELTDSGELYDTADDQHLLNMSMSLYTKNPRDDSTHLFNRPATDHWWLTGFKIVSSHAVPGKMVMVCTIRFRDSEMADSFIKSLKEVRGRYFPLAHFVEVKSKDALKDDSFYREGNAVTLCWRAVGWLNYDFPSDETTTTAKGN